MSNNKQTAVEWLYNNLKSHFEHDGDLLEVVQMSFDQAKEMEKEQIEKTFEEGMFHHINGLCPDEYYNETFKKTEQ